MCDLQAPQNSRSISIKTTRLLILANKRQSHHCRHLQKELRHTGQQRLAVSNIARASIELDGHTLPVCRIRPMYLNFIELLSRALEHNIRRHSDGSSLPLAKNFHCPSRPRQPVPNHRRHSSGAANPRGVPTRQSGSLYYCAKPRRTFACDPQ